MCSLMSVNTTLIDLVPPRDGRVDMFPILWGTERFSHDIQMVVGRKNLVVMQSVNAVHQSS